MDQAISIFLKRLCSAATCRMLMLAGSIIVIYLIFIGTNRVILYSSSNQASDKESRIFYFTEEMKQTTETKVDVEELEQQLINKTMLVLLWNIPSVNYRPSELDEKCGLCDFTSDRQMAAQSDAIVFHFKHSNELPDPLTRRADQLYVWLCRESPWTTKNLYKYEFGTKFDNYFNATMTYKRNSDIYFPYIEILHRRPASPSSHFIPFYRKQVDEILSHKRHLVAWVVSNCGSTSGARRRIEYVNRLIQDGLDVDRFGACFPSNPFPKSRSVEAYEKLSEYKFYLAFENTRHCKDYVTEKFWDNALYSGSVPLVWGPEREDVENLAPPNSFIFVDDFRTNEELINYIDYLDKNDTAYREYFRWRTDMIDADDNWNDGVKETFDSRTKSPSNWMLQKSLTFGYCNLCRIMHTKRPRTSVRSIHDSWYGEENPDCLYGS